MRSHVALLALLVLLRGGEFFNDIGIVLVEMGRFCHYRRLCPLCSCFALLRLLGSCLLLLGLDLVVFNWRLPGLSGF